MEFCSRCYEIPATGKLLPQWNCSQCLLITSFYKLLVAGMMKAGSKTSCCEAEIGLTPLNYWSEDPILRNVRQPCLDSVKSSSNVVYSDS